MIGMSTLKGGTMPKKITALLLAFSAFGTAAQSAAADTHADFHVINYGPSKVYTCITDEQVGVQGAFGAWGDYVDGCTVDLFCPPTSTSCVAWEQTSIATESGRGDRVTQNARIRVINPVTAEVVWFRDHSCAGTDLCENRDSVRLRGGRSASVQCNGVREHSAVFNRGANTCTLKMDY